MDLCDDDANGGGVFLLEIENTPMVCLCVQVRFAWVPGERFVRVSRPSQRPRSRASKQSMSRVMDYLLGLLHIMNVSVTCQ